MAVVCFSNLLLEVVLTRIFSATTFYHFTFLAIALALFGLGASGVYVYIRSDRFPPEEARHDMAAYARHFAAASVLALLYVLANPIAIMEGTTGGPGGFDERSWMQLLLLVGVVALPFFCAGMVVSLGVLHFRADIDRLYFFDLTGAALAALAAGWLLGLFGGPSLVLAIAVCGTVGAVLVERPRGRQWLPLVAAVSLLALNLWSPFIRVPSVKRVETARTVFEEWNTFSRITVEQLANDRLTIKIDASASTVIAQRETIAQFNWRQQVSALAYSLFADGPDHVLIIGPGGGPDVVSALAAGANKVTGVEVNPIISETIMQDRFADASQDLYADDRVHIVTDEGRSYIRRSEDRYDVIQATLVDTWAATAAGAFALTENTLYTLEAFNDYFAHLTDAGAVTFCRWYKGDSGESTRLVLLAAAALERRGVPPGETRQHLYLAVKDRFATLVASRDPLTAEQLARLDAASAFGGFEVVMSPATPPGGALEKMVDTGAWGPEVVSRGEDLTPSTDDRPFFFYFVKPGDLFRLDRHFARVNTLLYSPAAFILLALSACLVAVTIGFILLPLALHRRDHLLGGGHGTMGRRAVAIAYFAVIGLAFITVEIALLQKLTFFLGHPSFALLVVLFSLLLATAVGARLSGLAPDRSRGSVALLCGLALAVVCALYAVGLGPLLGAWVAWPRPLRIVVAGALVGVCGLLMGFMLPSGIRLVSAHDAEIVAWGWGVNGASSVIGTVGATIVAMNFGFTTALLAGAGLYAVGGALAMLLGHLVRRAVATAPVLAE